MKDTASHKVGILGSGSWGSSIAHLLGEKKIPVTLWTRDEKIEREINRSHKNPRYLTGVTLPDCVRASTEIEAVIAENDIIVVALPSHVVRQVLSHAQKSFRPNHIIVNAAKGIEMDSLKFMHDVIAEALPHVSRDSVLTISGPGFALEIAQRMPTFLTLAGKNPGTVEKIQTIFSNDFFRLYSSDDLVGVQIGGSLKNVIAIAAGICDGLGFGTNSRTGIITRGLSEIARLGKAMGANPITFLGLSGMGDLILTCTGDLSRNRKVGYHLGQGQSLSQALSNLGMVAEGVNTARAAVDLAKKFKVEMIICEHVYDILYRGKSPRTVAHDIMMRDLKPEFA